MTAMRSKAIRYNKAFLSPVTPCKKLWSEKQAIAALIKSCWLPPAIIFALTIVAFIPALQNGFVDWDDDKLLLQNTHCRGLRLTQLSWMFTTFHMGHYQPLSWITFAIDYLVWGMDPVGYRLSNGSLHAINAVLFYLISAATAAGDLTDRRWR